MDARSASGDGEVATAPDAFAQRNPRASFQFLGEALALDLVNTEIVVRRRRRDLLETPGAYTAWWRAAVERHPMITRQLQAGRVDPDQALLATVRQVRAALRAIFESVAEGAMIPDPPLAVLNGVLLGVHDEVEIYLDGSPHAVLAVHGDAIDETLAAVARSALDLLTRQDRARLRRCANPHCILLFYDTTRSATRRWCSVACRNRARSSERYRARKGVG